MARMVEGVYQNGNIELFEEPEGIRTARVLVVFLTTDETVNLPEFRAKYLLKEKREEILSIAEKYGASDVRVFGAVARGDMQPGSSVEVLVNLEQGRSMFDLLNLEQELQDMLGCKVVIATEEGLHQAFRQQILTEARPL